MDRGILNDGIDLQELARESARAYQTAAPFAHIALDGLFSPARLGALIREFPGPGDIAWQRFRSHQEVKLASTSESQFPSGIKQFLYQLNSSTWLRFLETLTGIEGLIPDPHFVGGGMHQSVRGGKLDVHADFNKHPEWGLDRRLNLLVYLNEGWRDEYGGHLELWDREMRQREAMIAPLFNRMVVFSTTDSSYHGHPHPLACPEGVTRRSLALYYYSNGRPEEQVTRRHSTLYRALPTDSRLRRYVGAFIPPIAYTLFDKLRRE